MPIAMGELDAGQAQRLLEHHALARLTCHGTGGPSTLPVRYTVSDHDHVCVYAPKPGGVVPLAVNSAIRLEVDEIDGPSSWSTVIGWGFVEGTPVGGCGPGAYNIRLTVLRGFYRGADRGAH